MSETTVEIVIHSDAPETVTTLQALFPTGGEVEHCGGYHVESAVFLDNVIIASVIGGSVFDDSELLARIRAHKPQWLMFDSFDNQVGEGQIRCYKQNKKAGKRAVTKAVRELSKQADLYFALAVGESKRAAELIEEGKVDLDMIIDGRPLLFSLIVSENFDLFRLAVNNGANVHARFQRSDVYYGIQIFAGMNLLGLAVQLEEERDTFMNALLEAGVDVNEVDEARHTPFSIACTFELDETLVGKLLDAGAHINYEWAEGMTALFEVLGSQGRYQPAAGIPFAARLMERGADIHHVSRNGLNARWVVQGGAQEAIDFVESHGITACVAPQGYYRAEFGSFANVGNAIGKHDVNALREHCDVGALKSREQWQLAMWAFREQSREMLEALIEAGIPPHVKSPDSIPLDVSAAEEAEGETQQALAAYLKEARAAYDDE